MNCPYWAARWGPKQTCKLCPEPSPSNNAPAAFLLALRGTSSGASLADGLSVEPTGTERADAQEDLMATADYLKRRGHTWFVRVQIPAHLWKAAGGRREYVKTLKTGDLTEANRLKHAHVAAFKRKIEALERGKTSDVLDELYEKAAGLAGYSRATQG